jgi:DNA-binding XRE family transcriptional regulator
VRLPEPHLSVARMVQACSAFLKTRVVRPGSQSAQFAAPLPGHLAHPGTMPSRFRNNAAMPHVSAHPGRLIEDEPLPHLRAWRRHQSYSQRELAARAGLDASTLHRLELGSPARPSTLRVLAQALGISPSQLRRQPPE